MSENTEYLELHYYLKNEGHAMDAKLLNKAEAEFIKIVDEVAVLLNLEVRTNILPKKEGGLETFYEFIVAPDNEGIRNIIAFFGGIIATIVADVVADKIKTDPETEKIKKDNLRLDRELKLKELEKYNADQINDPKVIQLRNELSISIAETNKVKIAKSNYYRNIDKDNNVERLSTREVSRDFEPLTRANVVPKTDFKKFIIEEADIDPDYKSQINLEVISPVLKRSRANWRGVYSEIAFSFKMMDKDFQQLVIQKNLSFSSGTYLVCDLETKQRLDTEGEVKTGARSVWDVTQIIYPDGEIIDIFYDDKTPPF